MSENRSSSASGGIGLGGALFITFLVLKLTGVIGWSWWWVTAPIWIPLSLVLTFLLAVAVLYGIARRRTAK